MLGTRPWRRPQLPAHGSASPNGAPVIAHRFREFAPPPQFGQMMRLFRSLCGTGGGSSAGTASAAKGRPASASAGANQPASCSRFSAPSVRPRHSTGRFSAAPRPCAAISAWSGYAQRIALSPLPIQGSPRRSTRSVQGCSRTTGLRPPTGQVPGTLLCTRAFQPSAASCRMIVKRRWPTTAPSAASSASKLARGWSGAARAAATAARCGPGSARVTGAPPPPRRAP